MNFAEFFNRYCALDDRQLGFALATSYPGLLDAKLLKEQANQLKGDPSPQSQARMGRLAELEAIRLWLGKHAEFYPAGIGPVEREARRVANGEISHEAAIRTLALPENAQHLTKLYSHLLIFHAEARARQGEVDLGLLWSRLLAEACMVACPAGEVSEALSIAAVGWIQLAGTALGAHANGKLLHDAAAYADRLLARLTDSADASRRGNLLHAMGCLYSDGVSRYVAMGATDGQRMWDRIAEADRGAVARHERAKYPLPDIKTMLTRALELFERALPDRQGEGRGITLKAIANTLLDIAAANGAAPTASVVERIKSLCNEALPLLTPGSYQHQATLRILQNVGAPATAEHDAPTDSGTSADTTESILNRASQIAADEPKGALAMLADAEPLFEAHGSEAHRRTRLMMMTQLIPRAFGGQEPDRFTGTPDEIAQEIARLADSEHWSADQLAATCIAVARQTGRRNAEETGLQLVAVANKVSPSIASYEAAIAFLCADLCIGAAVNHVDADRPVNAVGWYARALVPMVRLRMPAAALDLLQRIAHLAAQPLDGMSRQVLLGLAPVAFEVETYLGEPGIQALREVYEVAIGATGELDGVINVLGMLMQLAKGAHFDALLRAGAEFDWRRDEKAAAVHKQIEQLEKQVGGPGDFTPLDEVLLVTAFSEQRATPGETAAQQLQNLQQAFDRYVTDHLRVSIRRPAILNPEVIPYVLGPRTVLLDYYFARRGEKLRDTIIIVYTREEIAAFRNPVQTYDWVYDTPGAVGTLDSVALRTYKARAAVRRDPGDATLHPDAHACLANDFELLLGTPTWQHLETLRKAGKDHLCIRPYGALRYYPLQLLGPAGQDLAQQWIVTILPSLECLLRPAVPRRAQSACALGLTYRGTALPELTSTQDEITTVARIFDTQALLDDAVTEASVLAALNTARHVHLGVHGEHTPGSPLFHHLLVTPGADSGGRICAYELLGQDLRGLEVLSLGSCDSALGRFDAGDNLSGLPAAFLAAGASTLVAALWELRDDAALLFYVNFYRKLKAGIPRLDAFREAQLDVRAAFPQARDWAAFCYLGDWEREVEPVPNDIRIRFEVSG